jgi:hypothetical protein
MGYDLDELLCELHSQPAGTHELVSDVGRLIGDVVREPVRCRIRRRSVGGPNVLRELIGSSGARP